MRIEIEIHKRAKMLWEHDARVAAFAPEIWQRLERIANGTLAPSFSGVIGGEYVLTAGPTVIVLVCARPSHDKLQVLNIEFL